MLSSRIGFRARKVRRAVTKRTLAAVSSSCDAEATTREKDERSGSGAGNAGMGCEIVGFVSSKKKRSLKAARDAEATREKEKRSGSGARKQKEAAYADVGERANVIVDVSDGRDRHCVAGEADDRTKSANKDTGKRKRKLPGRAADLAPVGSVSFVAPSLEKNIKQADEELESIAAMSVTSLFEPGAIADAISHLKECDPKLRAVIETEELPSFQKCASAFSALVRSIVYQQLATKAATVIFKRLVSLCGGDALVTPATILELPAPELRNVGISLRKAGYLHDLARNFTVGELTDASISLMEDATLMSTLTAVKGIGTWSVHMFMIFSLHRPDVLPVGDLGVRKGFQKLYNLPSLPSPIEMEKLAASWRPYRTLGAWYMWRLMAAKGPVTTSKEES